jgi:Tol biopolymer transport system component
MAREKSFVRLTNFNDYQDCKASNPVISADGKYMSFQSGKTTDAAGVGYGPPALPFLRR